MTARDFNRQVEQALARLELIEPELLLVYERLVVRSAAKVASAFRRRVPALTAAGEAPWNPPLLADLIDEDAIAAAVRKETGPIHERMLAEALIGIDFDVKNPLTQGLLDEMALRAVDMAEGIREPTAKAIATAYINGYSVPDTAKLILQDVTSIKTWQATQLARNDLIGISNGGSLVSARTLRGASQDAPGFKQWLSAGDALVRPSHASASGQTVPLDQPFSVGSSYLQHPGDPGGAHADVINCRCTMLFVDAPAGVRASAASVDRLAAVSVIEEEAVAQAWVSDMAFENYATEDGRFIMAGAVSWRDLPLTLMAMIETTMGGHLGAQVAGRIDSIKKVPGVGDLKGVTVVHGTGEFTTEEYGQEIARYVEDQTLRGVSIDFIVEEFAFRDPETEDIIEIDDMTEDLWERAFMGELQTAYKALIITACTVCPTPAFADATISLAAAVQPQPDGSKTTRIYFPFEATVNDPTLTASAAGMAPVHPPRAWFDDPQLDGPTALTFHDDGRVEGHLALWDSCHIGEPSGAGVCVTPPRSASGYAYFHLGEVECDDNTTVAVGKVTLDTGHADLRQSRAAATRHYDDTGTVVADVRAGEDAFGIWVAGAARPDVPASTLRSARAAVLSGDWRRVGTGLEMVAALGVNVGGFPVPRVAALVAPAEDAEIEALSLVAAGICVEAGQEPMGQLELQGRLDALGMLAGIADVSLVAAPVMVITDDENGLERGSLVDQLRVLLADVSTVAASARGFHWNVQGSDYSEASALYGAIFTDLSASIEQIADSIKQLGGQSPYALDDLQQLRNIPDASQTLTAVFDMTFQLKQQNEQLLAQLNSAFLAAAESEEQGIQNFLAERIDVHKRWAWQMRVQLAA